MSVKSTSPQTACPPRIKRITASVWASVAATVKRHNGTLSIAAKDGVFSAHILLSL